MPDTTINRNEILQMVMDNIPQAIFMKDVNSRYLGCNKVFAKDAGLASADDIVGLTDFELPWLSEERESYINTDKRVMASGTAELGFEEPQTKNEKVSWLRTSKIPIYNSSNEIIGILGTYEDITEQKEMELAIKKNNRDLLSSNNKLEQINIDLERFSYAVTHDLQEPLRTIAAFIGIIKKQYLADIDEKGEKYVTFVDEGIERMSNLIRNTLNYSKLPYHEQINKEVFLKEVIEEKLKDLNSSIEETGARIKIRLMAEKMVCNRELMGIVISNLILNAIKFNKNSAPEIELEFQKLSNSFLFSIKDSGIGIEEKNIERIFQPYVRLRHEEVYRGTGLGLSICKRIINIHGGKIWADSVLGEGTRVTFEIPILEVGQLVN